MAANRALLPVEQTQEFLKELTQRMDAKVGDKVKIQIGKNPVYEGVVGQEPDMSKLTEARAGVLRAAIDIDIPQIGSKGDPSNLKQAIILEKNDEQVFWFEKGQVLESKLLEAVQVQSETLIEGIEVVQLESQEQFPVAAFESVTAFEELRKEVEASELPQNSSVRASNQDFVQQKEQQAKLQQEENFKNWQWFQMSRMEDRSGTYEGSISIQAIQELAVSKAPVPENLRSERDGAVSRAEQFVIQVALKALEQDGKEILPGVKMAEVGGYQITKNDATGDLAIDKPNQTFLRQDTGKIEQSYRPDGVLKAKGEEVTQNRLLVKDLDNFDYIECKQLTRDNLEGLRDLVQTYGKEGNVPIETWLGGKKDNAKIEKMQGRAFVSEKAQMQIIESGKHLQVRDMEGNLLLKAYEEKVEKPMTREQSADFKGRYEVVQQVRQEKTRQLQTQKQAVGVEIGS
jgi:hypothetical protein